MIALRELAPDVANLPVLEVSSVAIDSRLVTQGALFLALAGNAADGHDFIGAAIANGAVVVFAQRSVEPCAVPLVVVDNLAARVSHIAGEFYGHPSRALQCVAVTGTNGKTSVAHFVAELARHLGCSAGFLGTTGWGLVGADATLAAAQLTTADAVVLQQRLRVLQDAGAELVALELSSHALQQHRGDGLDVDVAVFTNLSRDHLDYHGSMAEYGAAKARLFDFPGLKAVAINADDTFGAELVARSVESCATDKSNRAVLALVSDSGSSETPCQGEAAQLRITQLQSAVDGLRWQLITPWGSAAIATQVIGSYNAINLSLAIAALVTLGHDLSAVAVAAGLVAAPAGRLQRVSAAASSSSVDSVGSVSGLAEFAVYVDYAHTPDALVSVLSAVRAHCAGRLICVFGCGGDRDAGKRAPMGQAVCEYADVGFLTSDNPRFEDPLAIIADVVAGLPAQHNIQTVPDRRSAIAAALSVAGASDVVVIAGKGHENYQDIAGERLAFDDAAIAQELLGSPGIVAFDAGARGSF